MATSNIPSAASRAPAPPGPGQEIRIISHSTLYYWWVVWAVGFLMAFITWLSHDSLAVVPKDTKAYKNMDLSQIKGKRGETAISGLEGEHDILVSPKGKHLPLK